MKFMFKIPKDVIIGILLISCTIGSLFFANSSFGASYQEFWNHSVGGHPLSHWIDDGLMAIFFLLIGLELKREFQEGELKSPKQAILPIAAAIGGMLFPAIFYLAFNWGLPSQNGFGIPMSTDIAFVLAIIAILGSKIPKSLKVFLTALAVFDDLGAILIIAIFYTSDFSFIYLAFTLLLFGILFFVSRFSKPQTVQGEKRLLFFLLSTGIGLWILLMKTGIHATISGILVALLIPSRSYIKTSAEATPVLALSKQLEHCLHNPVYLVILPLFILANTAIPLNDIFPQSQFNFHDISQIINEPHVAGIASGLFFGKPLGILLGVFIAVRFNWAQIPQDLRFNHLIGAGFLGGIGFTMAIFVTSLSFDDIQMINSAKLTILAVSVIAAIIGSILLSIRHK